MPSLNKQKYILRAKIKELKSTILELENIIWHSENKILNTTESIATLKTEQKQLEKEYYYIIDKLPFNR